MVRAAALTLLLLTGCDRLNMDDRPQGWDADQEIKLLDLQRRVDKLERELEEARKEQERAVQFTSKVNDYTEAVSNEGKAHRKTMAEFIEHYNGHKH